MIFFEKKIIFRTARSLIRNENLIAEKSVSSNPKISNKKFRRMGVDGIVNDKKTLRMMEILANRQFQLTNAYMMESENTDKDK